MNEQKPCRMTTDDTKRIWSVLLMAALVVGGITVLSVVFALLGWWQLIFR